MHQIHTALASFGMSGLVFHGPLLTAHKGFRFVSVLERTKNESTKIYPGIEVVRTFEALCKDDNIELIIINTPDHTHYDLAMMAIKAGKHIVVEKPFTLSYARAMELAEAADKANLIISVFQNRRWDGDFLTVRQVIDKVLLGRLVSFESHFDRYRNFIQPDTWKEDAGSGTGTLYNLGSHMLDQALVLFGPPISLFADVRAMRSGSKVDDSFDVWMQYPDVKVLVRGSYLVREQGPRYILHGTEGSFLKWGIDPQEEKLKAGRLPVGSKWGQEPESDWGLLHTTTDGKHIRKKYKTLAGNYQAYYDNIYAAIREDQALEVTAEQGALVIRVIEAALQSSQENKVVRL